jgi:phosphate transport system permease protein
LIYACGLVVLIVAILMLYELFDQARPSISRFGFGFLTSQTWDPVKENFGILPIIYGTMASSLVALVIAVPVSVGCAIFVTDVAPAWMRTPVAFLIELLAAIPSIVYGLWGLFVLVPFVRDPVQKFLGGHFSFIPLFDGPQFGLGLLAAGIILAIMILPIITSISRDVLLAVPSSQREAMLALGATRWEATSRAVIPYARSGIVGGVILGLGRAIGETMAVTLVIGNGFKISASLFQPSHTIASTIASEFSEAPSELYRSALIEAGLVLLLIALLVNIGARLLVWRIVHAPARARE